MGKNKLAKFAENETFPNLFQPGYQSLIADGFEHRGKWNKDFFKNDNPIVVELGCGKGEYTVGLADRYRDKNFVGVDVKGARLWQGCKTSNVKEMNNVAFIRTKIQELSHFFGENEISEIWITFPDPQPRKSKTKKRLTSPEFLDRYRPLLKKDAVIHLKTDDLGLYKYTMEVVRQNNLKLIYSTKDLYNSDFDGDVLGIKTFYEKIWLEQGFSIKYVEFSLND